MLDGLDEVEPDIRDRCILPWFIGICRRYSNCAFIVSSRPVGYPAGLLRELSFSECELLDFTADQTAEFTRHWCTAIRLAQNETLAEAKREGTKDGDRIVSGFEENPYITSLARNPLMLSAICLVNHFEGGQLPKDRAVLYKLCVEGLLHNWDQRRGIRSDFSFEEKLRVSKEVAIRMQMQDRAEYDLPAVQDVFRAVLKHSKRAQILLEHIRYRTGLLLERRPGIFAFAHLTFQEYLTARAIYEGNLAGIDIGQLIQEHNDPRWQEVIALYCGLAPAPTVRPLIEALLGQSKVRAGLLAEAYLSAGPELMEDRELRQRVMSAVARAQSSWNEVGINGFSEDEFAPFANQAIGLNRGYTSHAYYWLSDHPSFADFTSMAQQLRNPSALSADGIGELVYIIHYRGDDNLLGEIGRRGTSFYSLPGPELYETQAELAFLALSHRGAAPGPGADTAFLQALNAILSAPRLGSFWMVVDGSGPSGPGWQQIRPLVKRLAKRLRAEGPEAANSPRPLEEWTEAIDRRHGIGSADAQQPSKHPAKKTRAKK